MENKKRNKKAWFFIPVISYIGVGILLFFCCSGCNSYYTQEALAFRLPFYVKSDAKIQDISEHENGDIYLRLSHSTMRNKGKELHILDIPSEKWKAGNYEDVSKRWQKTSGKYNQILEFEGINRDIQLIQIVVSQELCLKLIDEPIELEKFWNKHRSKLLEKDRIKIIDRQCLIIPFSRKNLAKKTVEVIVTPSYKWEDAFVSCTDFEIPEYSWSTLPENTIIAILEETDSNGNGSKLYIKHRNDSKWIMKDLGTPANKAGRYALKTCNIILFPITICCTIVCDICGKVVRKYYMPPIK